MNPTSTSCSASRARRRTRTIKRAYRRLARELPSRRQPRRPRRRGAVQGDQLAYETLSDPEKRRRYDSSAPNGLRGQRARATTRSGFGWAGSATCSTRSSAAVGVRAAGRGGAGQRASPAGERRRGGPRPRVHRGRLRGAARTCTSAWPSPCATCGGDRRPAGHHARRRAPTAGARRGAPGAPVDPRPDGHRQPVPPLRRHRGGDRLARARTAGARVGAPRSAPTRSRSRPASTTARRCA